LLRCQTTIESWQRLIVSTDDSSSECSVPVVPWRWPAVLVTAVAAAEVTAVVMEEVMAEVMEEAMAATVATAAVTAVHRRVIPSVPSASGTSRPKTA
jgi:hypothetical protein